MCGICGVLQLSSTPLFAPTLTAMTEALAHRGPDSEGYYRSESGEIGLGFRRLAIIDLATGNQPLYSEDAQVVLVFNGEIYNYRALRAELIALGHEFVTQTDSEVLVHGYEAWGRDLPSRLRGMFAFAIWDVRRGGLFLARDRMGQKPLYYAFWGESFCFASEIKALLGHPEARRVLNQEAVPEYLLLGYVLPPATMFDGIMKLAPGETLWIERDGTRQLARYWQPTLATDEDSSLKVQIAGIRERLEAAVEMRLMSDVPLGTFLSGGVDSSVITALAQRMTGQPIRTFTVGFDYAAASVGDTKFNVDLHYAEVAARAIGCQHEAIILGAEDVGLADLVASLAYALDEPLADSAIVQTIYITRLARARGVPVLLSGDGSDEIFGGYPFFQKAQQVQRYMRYMPAGLRNGLINPLVDRLPHGKQWGLLHKLVDKSRLLRPAEQFLAWEHQFEPLLVAGLLCREGGETALQVENLLGQVDGLLDGLGTRSVADRVAYARLRLWLAENSNMRVDKLSMWSSVEVRAPFQDHELVDFALGIPLARKLPMGGKAILKAAVADLIPEAILKRPKWGFNPPMSDWLRGPLRPLVERYLSAEYLALTGLRAEVIQPMVAAHMSRRGYFLNEIWALLALQLWYAAYIAQDLPKLGSAEALASIG